MKTKLQVMAQWKEYCKQYALDNNFDLKKELMVRDECAKEVTLFINHPEETHLVKRIEKYTRMFSSDNIKEANVYDPCWKYRLDFLRWIVSE